EEEIKDDGTISPPSVGTVQAAGKTTGELQKELQEAYRKYYVSMTITLKSPDRYYSVGGYVKTPNRQIYVGGTTVIKAIQSAGDLTEFANRKKIQLTRANGKTYIINYDKALRDSKLDLPVFPGDSIHVPQRRF
ncbi:MAG: polysaccharide biosynthesis/export family protein, partial [Verrucomicrobiota bacterium]